jgi:plastocyanin
MDGFTNGGETDTDCGGPCADCADGSSCLIDGDCVSGGCVQSVCGPINGCSLVTAQDLTSQSAVTVQFTSFSYTPKCIKVAPGTQITFQGSFVVHPLLGGYVSGGLVPASSGPFVPATNMGTSKTFTMSSEGTFPYYCQAHALSGMTGAVFVDAP